MFSFLSGQGDGLLSNLGLRNLDSGDLLLLLILLLLLREGGQSKLVLILLLALFLLPDGEG